MNRFLRAFSVAASLAVAVTSFPLTVHAADTSTATISVQYSQSDTRRSLGMLNEFRAGSHTFTYDYTDIFRGIHEGDTVSTSDLPGLQWDYGLEQAAMQRAAEMAVYYTHTRPNGKNFYSGYPKNQTGAEGECSTWGNFGIEGAMNNLEDNMHMPNLLGKNYNTFAMAGAYWNGMHYWVMEFGYSDNIDSNDPGAADGAVDMDIEFKNDQVTTVGTLYSSAAAAINLSNVGDTHELPAVWMDIDLVNPPMPGLSFVPPTNNEMDPAKVRSDAWTSSNPSVATIQNGKIVATGNGSTQLSATILGQSFTCTVFCGENGMNRLYNPNSGEHFYTSSAEETDIDVAAGWNYEGVGWVAPTSGTPVLRMYNPVAGEHHYTTSRDEADNLVNAGWNLESDCAWYSAPETGIPVYREYNPNAYSCNHNYTPSNEENSILVGQGWNYEGISWYAIG
jgi:hypothetical protein